MSKKAEKVFEKLAKKSKVKSESPEDIRRKQDLALQWHAGTFNINAATKKSDVKARVSNHPEMGKILELYKPGKGKGKSINIVKAYKPEFNEDFKDKEGKKWLQFRPLEIVNNG